MKQLWAPWRLEYIKSADEESGCVFCLAAEGDDEERLVVHRGENAIALLNKYPYSSGHFMVAPIRHVGEYGELSAEEVLELHRLSSAGMGALAQVYAPQGTTSGGTSGGSPARAWSTTSICTSCLAGPVTRTSCRSLRM